MSPGLLHRTAPRHLRRPDRPGRRRPHLRDLLHQGARADRAARHRAAALLHQGAAGEPAAPRGRAARLGRRHRRRGAWGANPEGHGQGAGDAAHEIAFTPERVLMQDFTGVPGGRRPGRHARRAGPPRRRRLPGQPARPRRARHRPLGHRRALGRRRVLRRERLHRVLAQPRALPAAALGPGRLPRLPPRAARHGHLPPGQPRVPVAARLRHRRTGAPSATRSSAPTRTPSWSTGSACSAGASAGSRPRRPCSASRCPCCCRRWSGCASPARPSRASPRPTWC